MNKAFTLFIVCFLVIFHPNESTSSAFPLRNIEPGGGAPRLTLPTLDGGEADVLGADGEITVILFWGTDSKSKIERAVELLKTLQSIRESYGDRGVAVRSVNVDKGNRDALRRLVEDAGTTVPVLLDEEEKLYGTYGLFIFPTVAIVNRDGTLRTAVGYTHSISEHITGEIQVMLGLKTAEELEKELNPEEVIEPPDNVMKAARRLNLGRKFLEKKLFNLAGPEFEKAVELDPENAEAHTELGAFYARNGEYDRANTELARAVELEPDSIGAHFALGTLHHGRKEFVKAVAELEGVLAKDPTHTRAMRELGSVYEDMGNVDKALEYYRNLLSLTFEGGPPPNDRIPGASVCF